ncbi:CLUMA_CG011362, isoform A [Clunio marinus]|uniref:CLUMA_CG011362, isoform A n=1 Tax=Clunio marinus TaxID=568069 RepID=A0A1J1IHR1_9DIPT|nr:CLUMA_CG011362, isoform A [Clunio marinus]
MSSTYELFNKQALTMCDFNELICLCNCTLFPKTEQKQAKVSNTISKQDARSKPSAESCQDN